MNDGLVAAARENAFPFVVAAGCAFLTEGAWGVAAVPAIAAAFLAAVGFDMLLLDRRAVRRGDAAMESLLKSLDAGIRLRCGQVAGGLSHAILSVSGRDQNVEAMARRMRARISLGQDFAQAAGREADRAREGSRIRNALGKLACGYSDSSGPGSSVESAHSEMEALAAADRERAMGSLQKYLIIGMVFSTILPSMAVFAFVGYSTFYYSGAQLLVFTVVMLAIMPMLATMAASKIDDINEA